ncbi:MAG: type II secretion system protein GspM [Nitrospirota bacterium]
MNALRDLWRRLSRREQRMLAGGAAVVAAILLYLTAIDPVLARMGALDRLIPQKRQELEQLARLREDYLQLQRRIAVLDRQVQSTTPDFSLLAFLEAVVQEQVGRPHLAGIRPQPGLPFEGYEETVVEVQLERVSLGQIVAFLSGLEQSPYRLRTKRLEVKSRFKAEELLDAKIEVAAYQRHAAAAAGGQS